MLTAAEINAQHAIVKKRCALAAARIPHAGRKSGSTADRHVVETALVARLRAQAFDLPFAHDVVHRIKDADAVRRLCQVREHSVLCRSVVLERPVPFDMVGRDVEQHGNVRTKPRRGCKLIGRNLCNEHVGISCRDRINARIPDIAARNGSKSGRREHVRRQGSRGGLAVGAGDGDPTRARRRFAPRELDLAYHFLACAKGVAIEVREFGYARARNAQMVGAFDLFGIEGDMRTASALQLVGEPFGILRALARQNGQRVDAGADQARKVGRSGFSRSPQAKNENIAQRGWLALVSVHWCHENLLGDVRQRLCKVD